GRSSLGCKCYQTRWTIARGRSMRPTPELALFARRRRLARAPSEPYRCNGSSGLGTNYRPLSQWRTTAEDIEQGIELAPFRPSERNERDPDVAALLLVRPLSCWHFVREFAGGRNGRGR